MHRPRVIVSKRELLEHLYDYNWEHHSNVIEAHVSNLRKKLAAAAAKSAAAGPEPAEIIETMRGRGYRLAAEAGGRSNPRSGAGPMKSPLLHRSIAFRLIVAVLAVELLSAVLVVFLSFGYERHTHFHAFDVLLFGHADSILGAVQDAEDAQDNVMLVKADLHVPPERHLRGLRLERPPAGPLTELAGRRPRPYAAAAAQPLFAVDVNGREYRIVRIYGSRVVDPGKPGGGTQRQVAILYGAPTFYVWKTIFGTVEFYAGGSLLLLLVTGPLIAWLLHRGLLPLRQLAALASKVSVDSWQFSPPANARTTPELAPLTHAIESVLQRLERSFVQQRAFVSDAAHELKTAVAVVKSSLQLLGMKSRSVEEYKAGLERCLADSLRLEEIVANMLALARQESATPGSGPEPAADLAECLRRTVAQLATIASLRGVQVEVACPASSRLSCSHR
jgi:hypothetical protein